MGLWDFFSLSHFLIVFVDIFDDGTMGLWDATAVIKILREAHLTFQFSLFSFHFMFIA